MSLFLTPSCANSNNGSITVTTTGITTPGVTGGAPPYSYELVSPSPMLRSSQSSNTFTGLQPGGYTVKVTDACGKSATNTATVTQVGTNTSIGLGLQNIQTACGNTATGTATIFANGTAPPYTMALVNSSPVLVSATTAIQRDPITATYYTTFENLLPGLYTVEAIDGCGKLRRATFTVTASTAPTANTVASASCAISPTGTLTVTATAATGLSSSGSPGTYQYALIAPSPIIRSFQNSSVFENLLPGTYTIAVKDQCDNIGTATSTIATATAPTLGSSVTTSSCPNGATGTIEAQISAVGGGSSYTFELIAPSPVVRSAQSSNLFSNLPPGTYTIRLTDVCGSFVTTTATVSAATAPSFTSTVTASCSTPASGTITVAPSATSISPFTFELISPGAAIRAAQTNNVANSNSSIFTALNQGLHTIKMTDGCGVSVTNTATIAAPTALTFPTGSTTTPSCGSSSTGRITVAIPTTGLGAYRYELISPSPVTVAPQYSRIFDNIPAGSYTVRITDSCGSQVTIGTPLVVATATAPTLTVTNSASCSSSNTGTITCLATTANQGGVYQFALISPSPITRTNQTSPIFTGLSAGAYTIQITDQCGATGTNTSTIATAGAFTPAAGGSIASCNGSGYYGQLIVTNPQNYTTGGPIPTGSGGGPYTYALYDATNTTLISGPQSSNIFSTVTPVAGSPSHTIRVTDVCGNTSTTTGTINAPTALTIATITATTPSCSATNTGVVKVTTQATGGLPPSQYTLIDAVTSTVVAGPQTGTTFNSVPANATGYFVKSTDACGNTTTSSSAVLFPSAVAPTATTTVTASCTSPSTGSIIVTPGTGSTLAGGTFSYRLYDASNTTPVTIAQSVPAFTSLAPATYTVRITDRCGTTGTASATVSSSVTALTAAGTATGTCSSGSTGVISASSTGGSPSISYTLLEQSTSNIVAGPQSSNIFTGLAANTYVVRATDACSTTANSGNIVLSNSVSSPTITTSTAIDCAGSAILAGFGGGGNGGPYTYALCTGTGCTDFGTFSTTSTFTVLSSGTYRIAVRDKCDNQTASSDIVVTIPTKAIVTGVTKTNACGATPISVSYSSVPNTPYYSVTGSNFSTTLPASVALNCNTVRVTDYNSGTFGCASYPYNFSIFEVPTLNAASQANNWLCTSTTLTPAFTPSTGSSGCGGSGASFGVKLTACTGCTGSANAIGTIKASAAAFNISGATSATFVPIILVSSSEVCNGSSVTADLTNASAFSCSTLPIIIEYFNGNTINNTNRLTWKAYCYNTSSVEMILERSANGKYFEGIYTLFSDANRCTQPFEYEDKLPFDGINYYRLKMVDFDGSIHYSKIITLLNEDGKSQRLSISPNPVLRNGAAIINMSSNQNSKVQIIITDIIGRQLFSKMVDINEGNNHIELNLENLVSGTYQMLIFRNDVPTQFTRFVKE